MNEELNQYIQRRRKIIALCATDQFIETLENHFETNLPCFQGQAGQYDPLDAMRRDAYREVILFLRSERAAYERDNKQ